MKKMKIKKSEAEDFRIEPPPDKKCLNCLNFDPNEMI